MIDINEIFSDQDNRISLWCEAMADTNDLAGMADYIIKSDIHLISVPKEIVPLIWVYLEKSNVKILSRFGFAPMSGSDVDKKMYDLAANITGICKKGASGVQIFIAMRDFEKFTEKISSVRDDLFFGHDFCIVMDINEIGLDDWKNIFQKLRDIRVSALALTLNEDMKNRSDFVGRIYGMLQNWDADCELHFMLHNNLDRIDQVVRLVECEKPELLNKLKFFLDY